MTRCFGAWSRLALAAACLIAIAGCAMPPAAQSPPVPPTVPVPAPPPARPRTVPAPSNTPVKLDLAGEPTLDVGLAWDLDTLELELDQATRLQWRAPGDDRGIASVDGPIRVHVSGAQVVVDPLARRRAVPLALLGAGDTLWIGELAGSREGRAQRIGWNGKHWRGQFKVFQNPRGKLTLATRLPLETYLVGVVPGEIGALRDSLLEAGRAQAVAARSYTLFYMGRRGTEGFDLYGSVEDQVYGAVESERPLATRCVESTAGRVALSDGAPIRANYCSTCGGISAEAWEAWPTGAQRYLVSRADRESTDADYCASSTHFRWREEWNAAEFIANVARFAPAQGVTLPPAGAGELLDVQVASRSSSGRAWRLLVTTTTGTVVVPAYSIRQVLRRGGNPGAILRSNLFKIDVRRDPSTRRALAVVATGAGNGHGVGLCQVGALTMARLGARAEDILGHYYEGAELKKLY